MMDDICPQKRKSFLAEMETYFERNEPQTVLDLAQDRLKKSPDDLDSRIAICRAWLQQGRIDEVRDMLKEIEDILTGVSDLYVCMGDFYLKRGLENEAERFYQKFTALNPTAPRSPDLEVRLKDMIKLAGANDVEQEEEEGENADVPPDFETVTLAELYMRQGHLRMAEEILEKIAKRDPQNERAKGLLNDIGLHGQGKNARINDVIIAELTRWLDNIGNLRSHAA